jgi:hypothetical protein
MTLVTRSPAPRNTPEFLMERPTAPQLLESGIADRS